MKIADKKTLSVLMTALYVAKWESDDDNAHVAAITGSPFFARLYHDVVDEVVRLDASKPAAVRRWESWRAIEGRPDQLERTKARIRSMSPWSSWSREERLQMIEYLLSPFRATAATLDELVSLSP